GSVRRGCGALDLGLDLPPAAEAGIEHPAGGELIQPLAIVGEVLGLPAHRLLPLEAEPGEILLDRRLERWPAAGAVEILDAQQESAPGRLSNPVGEEGRMGMAEVKAARRARREAGGEGGDGGGLHRGGWSGDMAPHGSRTAILDAEDTGLPGPRGQAPHGRSRDAGTPGPGSRPRLR